MPNIHTRGGFTPFLTPNLRQVFIDTGKERPPEFSLVGNVATMDWNPETDQQVSGLGTMPPKPEGSQFTLDRMILGGSKVYTGAPFGSAIEFTWEMWRDELYSVAQAMVGEMGRSSSNRVEVSFWSVFNNAFSDSFVGFTAGESLVRTSHTGLDGVVRANRPSPDIGFSITGIQNAITRFEGLTDERNLPRLMAPVMAIIAPSNKFAAREILGSAGKPYTADNELNALIEEDLSWLVCHYLTTATNWFLVAAKGVHDLWFRWRDQPMFDGFDDPWTKNAIYTSYQRHTDGQFGSWRGVDGSTG